MVFWLLKTYKKSYALSHLSSIIKQLFFVQYDEEYFNQNGETFGKLLMPMNLEGYGLAMHLST